MLYNSKPTPMAQGVYLDVDGVWEGVDGGIQGLLVSLVEEVKAREGDHPSGNRIEVVGDGVGGRRKNTEPRLCV